MYSTLLPLLLIGRYQACHSHSGDPTSTHSQQQLVRQYLAQNRCQETRHHRHNRNTPPRSACPTTTLTRPRPGSAASMWPSPPAELRNRSQTSTGRCQSSRSLWSSVSARCTKTPLPTRNHTRSCKTSCCAPTASVPPRERANGWTTRVAATTGPPCGTSSTLCSHPQ